MAPSVPVFSLFGPLLVLYAGMCVCVCVCLGVALPSPPVYCVFSMLNYFKHTSSVSLNYVCVVVCTLRENQTWD